MWDDPWDVVRGAEQALRAEAPRIDATGRLDAALKLAIVGELLEQSDIAQRGIDLGVPLATQLHDDGALCVFDDAAGFIAQNSGQVSTTLQRYAEAFALAQKPGLDWCTARLHLGLGQAYSDFSRGAEALAELIEAHRLYELQHDTGGVALTLSDLSWIYHREQDNPQSLRRAIESGEAALAMIDPAHQRYLADCVHYSLAGAYLASHLLPQARKHVERAMEFAVASHDSVGTGYVAWLHGSIEMEAGLPDVALPLFDRAKSVFRDYHVDEMDLTASVNRVEALTALKRRAQARQELDAVEPLRRKLDNAQLDALYHQAALKLYETAGEFEKALRESKALTAAQQRHAIEDNRKAANESQERFETQRKEVENRLLREEQRASQSQRWLLLSTLVLALALLGVVSAYLFQQLGLRRRLAQLAARDDLTGIPNRRSILEIAREVAANRRLSHEPACIAMLDIDHFKAVNDTYGHDVGDAALVAFSRVCIGNLRGRDRLGRYGGEEFLLVLPGALVADLPLVFERLRTGLQATPVPGMPDDARLSFSMGCTLLRAEDEIEQAIHRADEALYRAKVQGRDRLAVASFDPQAA